MLTKLTIRSFYRFFFTRQEQKAISYLLCFFDMVFYEFKASRSTECFEVCNFNSRKNNAPDIVYSTWRKTHENRGAGSEPKRILAYEMHQTTARHKLRSH